VLDIAEDPHTLDIFEDLIGPNIRCWSMAWRVKKADAQTMAGWHQDSVYGSPVPVVLGALALSPCGADQGCLRGIPGSHKWGHLKHEESDDPKSILARGQYISDPFDESKAVDFVLQPGEMVMFHNSLVHGSSINVNLDRFDDEPRPDGEFTEAALANWKRVVDSRAKRLFEDSRYAPSEAYGGQRAAT
jgi:non-haem Fe2+, alpha-ketoglutarate-dependent halogenase